MFLFKTSCLTPLNKCDILELELTTKRNKIMQITQLVNKADFPKFILHLSTDEMQTIVDAIYKVSHDELATDKLSSSADALWHEFLKNSKLSLQPELR